MSGQNCAAGASAAEAIGQFRSAIAAAGLPIPDHIDPDGALHRFATNGKRGDSSGWYVLHVDGIPAGAFGDWRTGRSETWCAKSESALSAAERQQIIECMKDVQAAREAERQRRHAEASETARDVWGSSPPAETHPYLEKKGIQAHGTRVCDNALVVPMYVGDGELCSLQFIDSDGDKRFLPGGRVQRCYYPIDGDRSNVYVAEGFATAASIHEATGSAVAVCFTAGQILAVAQLMREEMPDATLVIAADNDVRDDDSENTGVTKATEAATTVDALLAVPELDGGKCDFNDIHIVRGLEAVRQQLATALRTEQAEFEEELRRLTELRPIRYDQEREKIAKRLGVRASAIDKEIEQRKRQTEESAECEVVEQLFTPVEPYDGEVNGLELAQAIQCEIRRYVSADKHAIMAAMLWILHTWAVAAAYIAPILLVKSPQKRCGKSTLLDVLRSMVKRGLLANSVSTAVVYRTMDLYRPTLLIDEADAFLDETEHLRGIINGGHSRATAKTLRIGGANRDEVEIFDSFGPKAIAGIGKRRDTISDRSIIVSLRRRRPDEKVEPLLQDRLDNRQIQSYCAAWADRNVEALRRADPAVPESLHDRAADNWRPLLAIAELCDVGLEARQAAIALSGSDDAETVGIMLLEDIRRLFAEHKAERLSSALIVDQLAKLEERPWPEWGRSQKPITPRQLAKLLEQFEIGPKLVKIDGIPVRGYRLDRFKDSFSRYLSKSADLGVTPIPVSNDAASGDIVPVTGQQTVTDASVTATGPVTEENGPKASSEAGGNGVTDKNAGLEGIEKNSTDGGREYRI